MHGGDLQSCRRRRHLLVRPSGERCAVQVLCLLALQIQELLLVLSLLALVERDLIVHVPSQDERTLSQEDIYGERGHQEGNVILHPIRDWAKSAGV